MTKNQELKETMVNQFTKIIEKMLETENSEAQRFDNFYKKIAELNLDGAPVIGDIDKDIEELRRKYYTTNYDSREFETYSAIEEAIVEYKSQEDAVENMLKESKETIQKNIDMLKEQIKGNQTKIEKLQAEKDKIRNGKSLKSEERELLTKDEIDELDFDIKLLENSNENSQNKVDIMEEFLTEYGSLEDLKRLIDEKNEKEEAREDRILKAQYQRYAGKRPGENIRTVKKEKYGYFDEYLAGKGTEQSAEEPVIEQLETEKTVEEPAEEKLTSEQVTVEKPLAEKLASEKVTAKKPLVEGPVVEKTVEEQPIERKPLNKIIIQIGKNGESKTTVEREGEKPFEGKPLVLWISDDKIKTSAETAPEADKWVGRELWRNNEAGLLSKEEMKEQYSIYLDIMRGKNVEENIKKLKIDLQYDLTGLKGLDKNIKKEIKANAKNARKLGIAEVETYWTKFTSLVWDKVDGFVTRGKNLLSKGKEKESLPAPENTPKRNTPETFRNEMSYSDRLIANLDSKGAFNKSWKSKSEEEAVKQEAAENESVEQEGEEH